MKHVLMGLALSLLLVGWSPPANAALGWFEAEVLNTGVTNGGTVIIRLTDLANVPAFELKYFSLPDLVSTEMLAVGLTALAANLSVLVRVDPDLPGTPEIRIMYLQNN